MTDFTVSYHIANTALITEMDDAIESVLGEESIGSGAGLGARDLQFESELSRPEVAVRLSTLSFEVVLTWGEEESPRTAEMDAVIDQNKLAGTNALQLNGTDVDEVENK